MSTRYAVVDRPGYFGDVARIYSVHKSLALAKRAMGAGYIDECGRRRRSTCVVEARAGDACGGTIYADEFASGAYKVLA